MVTTKTKKTQKATGEMKFEEFREQQHTTTSTSGLVVEFHHLPQAQTMIVVKLPIGHQISAQKTWKTEIAATTILGCFDAWDLYRTLNK